MKSKLVAMMVCIFLGCFSSVFFVVVSSSMNTFSTSVAETQPTIHYQSITVKQLYDELEKNPLRTEKAYQDAYVVITAKLSVIDNDGVYIGIIDFTDVWGLESICCSITDNSQIDKIIHFNKGDKITVYGQITSVREDRLYTLDIIDIE